MESLFKEVEALFDVISSDTQTADDGRQRQRHATSNPDHRRGHREGASSQRITLLTSQPPPQALIRDVSISGTAVTGGLTS
jgi:hypothetical protein